MSYLLEQYVRWRRAGRSSFDAHGRGDRESFSKFANLSDIIPEFEMEKLEHEFEQRMN